MNLIIIALLTGAATGILYGYLSTAGQFCMNSGFKQVYTKKDYTKFNAYFLAISIQMMVLPVLSMLGLLQLNPLPLNLPGAMIGGYLFGIGMTWAGGCAAGIWFKLGEGNSASIVAVLGFIVGIVVIEKGILIPIKTILAQYSFNLPGKNTLAGIAGLNDNGMGLVIGVAIFILLMFKSNSAPPNSWNWKKTGTLIGMLAVAAWFLSIYSGRHYGLAVTGGSYDVFNFITSGKSSFSGWETWFVLSIPLGAFVFNKIKSGSITFSPLRGSQVGKRFTGGVLLGTGSSIAGGCTVGHGLTGVPMLALGSIVALMFIVLGVFTVGFFEKRST